MVKIQQSLLIVLLLILINSIKSIEKNEKQIYVVHDKLTCQEKDKTGKCINCHNHFFLKDGECHRCTDRSCLLCSSKNCFKCHDSFYLESSGNCKKCPPKCEKCHDNGKCVHCESFYSLVDGQCIDIYSDRLLSMNQFLIVLVVFSAVFCFFGFKINQGFERAAYGHSFEMQHQEGNKPYKPVGVGGAASFFDEEEPLNS